MRGERDVDGSNSLLPSRTAPSKLNWLAWHGEEYGSVSHEAIQQVLKTKGCPEGFRNYVIGMYGDSCNGIAHGDWQSAPMHPTTWVQQGDPLVTGHNHQYWSATMRWPATSKNSEKKNRVSFREGKNPSVGNLKVILTRVLTRAMTGFRIFSSGTMMIPAERADTTRDIRRRVRRERIGVG